MTLQQMQEVDAALQRGETPEGVARRYGLTRNGLSFQLLQVGKKIAVYRRLVDTEAPQEPVEVQEPRELVAA